MKDQACEGFAWVGQSLLCCDDCGWPWFFHAGDKRRLSNSPFDLGHEVKWQVVPWSEDWQAQVPALIEAWDANALWQREQTQVRDWLGRFYPGSLVERQVGKDFPYATGPTRPI